ncbi:MAG: metallophosphoesterase [Anaerolineae bacterium]|nr:metallophosphoesterase [Anaerolineae bacterium]MCB9106284.1 metallophosphoesterase [Anaerolineales bacterium]
MNLPATSINASIEIGPRRRLRFLWPVFISFLTLLLLGATPHTLYAEEPVQPPPNFTVAFIGDQGVGPNAQAVLDLIHNEGAAMVLHQGDFDYQDNPDAWDQQINDSLGATFPYFASVGNHDVSQWAGYQQKLQARLDSIPEATCVGELGVNAACHYQGLFFILSGIGTLGSDHEAYLREQLAADDSLWTICSWHKNQNAMQVGGKPDEVGWGAYEACREDGAIIATGHEHSYERTRTLSHIESQTVDSFCDDDPATPDPDVCVSAGRTFVVVSGIAGAGIRDQERCLPATYPYGCAGEWAKIYTSDQGAQYGALFITFHVEGDPKKALGYFKTIDGEVIDSFTVTATAPVTYHTFIPIIMR